MNFLILGYFRSGTTFLSNILNSHPACHCVVDPFIILIKVFRNQTIRKLNLKVKNKNHDLESFVTNTPREKKLLNHILKKSSFNEKITKKDIIFFHKKLIEEKKYQHPRINTIKINTNICNYRDMLNYYIKYR